jgi:hypothetical protein
MEGIVSQFAGIYREWAPHVSLRGHVRCLWINDLSGSCTECLQVVPDGCVDIVWTGETLCIAGPDTGPFSLACRAVRSLWECASIPGRPLRGWASRWVRS